MRAAAGTAGGSPPDGPGAEGSRPRRPPVGREIRRWRRERGLVLARVAERSGLNIGYLSQIENDKALPSLDALVAIAGALDVPVAWLLLDAPSPPRVVRAADRPRLAAIGTGDLSGVGEVSEVDGGTSHDVCILEAVVPPGRRTGVHAHAGDEHHVILSGRWRMTQGAHVVELGPGDYLAWDPTTPHDVENVGDEPGRILMVYPRHARRGVGETADVLAMTAQPPTTAPPAAFDPAPPARSVATDRSATAARSAAAVSTGDPQPPPEARR